MSLSLACCRRARQIWGRRPKSSCAGGWAMQSIAKSVLETGSQGTFEPPSPRNSTHHPHQSSDILTFPVDGRMGTDVTTVFEVVSCSALGNLGHDLSKPDSAMSWHGSTLNGSEWVMCCRWQYRWMTTHLNASPIVFVVFVLSTRLEVGDVEKYGLYWLIAVCASSWLWCPSFSRFFKRVTSQTIGGIQASFFFRLQPVLLYFNLLAVFFLHLGLEVFQELELGTGFFSLLGEAANHAAIRCAPWFTMVHWELWRRTT